MKKTMYEKLLERVRAICLSLPEAVEVEAWGHPTFRAGKKMFAGFGAESTSGAGATLGLNVGFDRQEELLKDPRFCPTPYAAHRGWVSLNLGAETDWEEMKGLITEAYRQVALKRMLTELEAGLSGPA